MNSDNFEFAKSSAPQGVGEYTPYTDKAFNSVNDINSGVYTNSGLSLVQFDLTSIYNSSGFNDSSDLYMTIPIVLAAGLSTSGGAVLTPATSSAMSSLLSLKSNYQHLIHQIEIVADGKVCSQMSPYASVYTHFRMLSQMTRNDLANTGVSLGFSDVIDSENSVQWDPLAGGAATAKLGQGLNNNRPYLSGTAGGQDGPYLLSASQTQNCVNSAISRRVSRFYNADFVSAATFAGGSANSYSRIYGTAATGSIPVIMTKDDLNAEFKPFYTLNGNIATWYDVAIIPLKYFCDVIDKMGLVKRSSLVIRAYLNTGTLSVPVANPNTTTLNYGGVANSTFSNTVPFTVNWLGDTEANGGLPATTANIVAGCYIVRPPTTSVTGVNLGLNAVAHPMSACRMNYSMIKLDPARALKYIEENRAKEVVFENFITNQYNSIPAGGTFSQLVQSGIKNPIALVLVPTISSTQTTLKGGSTALGFNQWQSPTDTFPATFAPISLTNLQVQLGGINVLSGTPLYYTYENFLQQVAGAERLTSSDFTGIECGLISQKWWEMNRIYYVDLARGREADRATMRNLTVSFRNQSQVAVDLLVYTVYLDRIVLDVETGKVSV